MVVVLYTKANVVSEDGSVSSTCVFCDNAVEIMRSSCLEYTIVPTTRDELEMIYARHRHDSPVSSGPKLLTWPFCISVDESSGKETLIGDYTSLRKLHGEPLLLQSPSKSRYTLFPIVDQQVYQCYLTAVASFWTVDEIDLSKDWNDWKNMHEDERFFIKNVLAFFAAADGIVNENLASKFSVEVVLPEARAFYSYQIFNETIHNQTYSTLIDFFIRDGEDEKERIFNAIDEIRTIRDKAMWCEKYIVGPGSSQPFAIRLIVFAIVEGLFFSSSFASIFWLKKRGIMPGLCFSNELISRDEGMHQDFACLLFSRIRNKPTQETVHAIVKEAVILEQAFCDECLRVNLIGLNSEMMKRYVEFVADRLVTQIGYDKIYNTVNPLDFMEMISLESKTNFFERRVGEYQKSGVVRKREAFSCESGDF